jgi:hypothetical protein
MPRDGEFRDHSEACDGGYCADHFRKHNRIQPNSSSSPPAVRRNPFLPVEPRRGTVSLARRCAPSKAAPDTRNPISTSRTPHFPQPTPQRQRPRPPEPRHWMEGESKAVRCLRWKNHGGWPSLLPQPKTGTDAQKMAHKVNEPRFPMICHRELIQPTIDILPILTKTLAQHTQLGLLCCRHPLVQE